MIGDKDRHFIVLYHVNAKIICLHTFMFNFVRSRLDLENLKALDFLLLLFLQKIKPILFIQELIQNDKSEDFLTKHSPNEGHSKQACRTRFSKCFHRA